MCQARTDTPDEPNKNKHSTLTAGRKLSETSGRLPMCYWMTDWRVKIILVSMKTEKFLCILWKPIDNFMSISWNSLLRLNVICVMIKKRGGDITQWEGFWVQSLKHKCTHMHTCTHTCTHPHKKREWMNEWMPGKQAVLLFLIWISSVRFF